MLRSPSLQVVTDTIQQAPAQERGGLREGAAIHEDVPTRVVEAGKTGCFPEDERRALSAVAAAAMPEGAVLPGAGAATVARVEVMLAGAPVAAVWSYRGLIHGLQGAARLYYGRALSALSAGEIVALCERFHHGGWARRQALRMLLTPLKVAHFDDPALFAKIGCVYGARSRPQRSELPRHVQERTTPASEVPQGEVLECDAVVIGSGAGGAVAARELAAAGHAVILLEEGQYFTRADFTGHAIEMQRKLYRDMGATLTVGNCVIPVPIGKSVGGTTTINSGTCYRAPERVLRKWRAAHGLVLDDRALSAAYERVEDILGVAPAQAEHLGGVARVIARGCDALGYRHRPLRRNAPACDGQGVCYYGCPTDAKRSTNVSYVPLALQAGAQLFTGARAESVILEHGRACGVRVLARDAAGQSRRFQVRARAVVVACGSLLTPVFLLSDKGTRAALSRSGQLGSNLTIHPAMAVFALMSGEQVRGYEAIPQGYAIEEFHDEGLLMEGVFAPLELAAASLLGFGPGFMAQMESYDRIASFGFMIEEESRGRVRPGPGGRPLVTYTLVDNDVARIKRGVEILSRVYFAAGAEVVLPQLPGLDELRSPDDLRLLRSMQLRARDLPLTAYHPLGTARMGRDPRTSVVDESGQAHDLPGLYVCDGSVLPGSPAVNPQLTIMALATRIGQQLATRLA